MDTDSVSAFIHFFLIRRNEIMLKISRAAAEKEAVTNMICANASNMNARCWLVSFLPALRLARAAWRLAYVTEYDLPDSLALFDLGNQSYSVFRQVFSINDWSAIRSTTSSTRLTPCSIFSIDLPDMFSSLPADTTLRPETSRQCFINQAVVRSLLCQDRIQFATRLHQHPW